MEESFKMHKVAAKDFLKSYTSYKTYAEMVKKAVDPIKPTLVKAHSKNRERLFLSDTLQYDASKKSES